MRMMTPWSPYVYVNRPGLHDQHGSVIRVSVIVIYMSSELQSSCICCQDYTITIYLNQYWIDDRLAFARNNTDTMTLTGDFAEKIWVPDTFFANDKNSFLHDVTEKNKMVRLHGDGAIAYGMR